MQLGAWRLCPASQAGTAQWWPGNTDASQASARPMATMGMACSKTGGMALFCHLLGHAQQTFSKAELDPAQNVSSSSAERQTLGNKLPGRLPRDTQHSRGLRHSGSPSAAASAPRWLAVRRAWEPRPPPSCRPATGRCDWEGCGWAGLGTTPGLDMSERAYVMASGAQQVASWTIRSLGGLHPEMHARAGARLAGGA